MPTPKRLVHLDFHTSPEITGIGSRFDKKSFQNALREGHVESITVFDNIAMSALAVGNQTNDWDTKINRNYALFVENNYFRHIGYAYEYVEAIAPYSFDGKCAATLGIYPSTDRENYEANEGISTMLQEAQLDFDVVHDNNFSDFDTVIFPAGTRLDETGKAALAAYLHSGGKLLLEADALVENGSFALDLGFSYLGAPESDNDFLLSPTVTDAPVLCNHPAHRVRADGAECLAEVLPPYFNRTLRHYCGHKNTPHDKDAARLPAILRQGNVVYAAHPLSRQYFEYGSIYHKRIFLAALATLYTRPLLSVTGMMSGGRVSLIAQEKERRYALHLLYGVPTKRGNTEVIEDLPPVYNVGVTLRTEKKISRVALPLSGEELPFTREGELLQFRLPSFTCHTVITIEYKE